MTRHNPRKFLINPDGGPIEIILKASGGDSPEESDILRSTLSHASSTGAHVLEAIEKSRGKRRWEIPAKFDTRVRTVDGLNIKLRPRPAPPPSVVFKLAIYVASRTGADSVIFADLFVRQDGKTIKVLGNRRSLQRFGKGLSTRDGYMTQVSLFLSHG